MPEFRPATAADMKLLSGHLALRRVLRRLAVRMAIKRSHIRLARTLKPRRGLERVSDLLWQAQMTAREAQSLAELARATRAQRTFAKLQLAQHQRLLGESDHP